MDDSIEWKEAKGGQFETESDDGTDLAGPVIEEDANNFELLSSKDRSLIEEQERENAELNSRRVKPKFLHQRIDLCLRRNITALSDPNCHKPKPVYSNDDSMPFEDWLDNAIIAISPTADLMLFAKHSPEKVAFIAKLRMEPINQYVTKLLNIPLDHNEQITSLLCLPFMSIQKTAIGTVDWTALVIGLSSGYVKFYTEQNICLLSFKFCDEPVISLKCQSQKNQPNGRSELHFASILDELMVVYRTCAVVIDGIGLYDNLRLAKDEVIRNGSNYEPAYNLANIPSIMNCQKWKVDDSTSSTIVMDADLLGSRKTTTFDSLLSDSVNFEHIPAKPFAKTLAFVGKNPFLSCYKESTDTNTHSYTEMIGSIFSLWNKPQPSRTQLVDVTRYDNLSLFDKERLATSVVPSPDKRLIAITDNFGRVLLVDATNWIVVRMWKGYRSAQCGWVEVKRSLDTAGCPHASFLVIYAPKRGLLEVWSVQRGPRVAAYNVGKHCRLLYSGYKMFNMRAERSCQFIDQSYATHCYLLNARSETVFLVDIPYTYSLYKHGDLKSRDLLLVDEISCALQNDLETEVISEILNRIALSGSLQISIQKITMALTPDRIVPIMENLINKIMKNYDNHAGETMTDDDLSMIELCKRIIRLCSIFSDLHQSNPNEMALPDVNQRLIHQYEEHPEEIDQFSEQLGWSTTEVLRYLSLLALDRSYRAKYQSNPWPNLGEPLEWSEYVSCFDLSRIKTSGGRKNSKKETRNLNDMSIRLKESKSTFLNQEQVVKTAIFMYNRLSENFYKTIQTSSAIKLSSEQDKTRNNYNYLEPASRLGLLFQFWLSTKLCNHWKMWFFLQDQVGQISDELKVIAMDRKDDSILIQTWKQIYNLILESDNIFAAITATAAIRSDTLRMIRDNEKREKLEASSAGGETNKKEDDDLGRSSIDWECVCIDAERMSLLTQQLEDVFLLNLLLKYSVVEGTLVENYIYKVPRISVANILRGGPTIVSELVAQWAIQSNINFRIFTQPYGDQPEEEINIPGPSKSSRLYPIKQPNLDNEEYAKELLHHTKTSYPVSLEADVILVYCIWEIGRRWTNSNPISGDKSDLLRKFSNGISLLSNPELKQKLTSAAYKTFFQRTLERLVILVETSSTIVNVKNSKIRDILTRQELNMSEDCLEEFVQFCCDLSEVMLQICGETAGKQQFEISNEKNAKENELREQLLTFDNWWSAPTTVRMLDRYKQGHRRSSSNSSDDLESLIKTILLTSSDLLSINFLVELNRLANLLNIIFKLKVIKAYPMSLIGEESRRILQLDLQQLSPIGNSGLPINLKSRGGSLEELRHKFAKKCILNVVDKLSEETNDFTEDEDDGIKQEKPKQTNRSKVKEDNDTKHTSPFIIDRAPKEKQSKGKPPKSKANQSKANMSEQTSNSGRYKSATNHDDDNDAESSSAIIKDENNEFLIIFGSLLSLANDWEMNCDELHLELALELYRNNHDKFASHLSTRIYDQQTLASGLLKISSQRLLVLFGLSPTISDSRSWKLRRDIWSLFQPNVASWLRNVQQEELNREIACLKFSNSVRVQSSEVHDDNESADGDIYNDDDSEVDYDGDMSLLVANTFGIQLYALHILRKRTKVVLESVTNYLDGQAGRLAYDMLELLESRTFDKFIQTEISATVTNKTTTSQQEREKEEA